jgi:methionyl-tRNA formyltransferase
MKKIGILVKSGCAYLDYLKWLSTQPHRFVIHADNPSAFPALDFDWTADWKQTFDADLVLSFGFWHKIPMSMINSLSLGCVNFHHSYRMKYRGRHMCTWAIRNGEKTAGSSIHYMDEGIDSGPIIATKSCPVLEDDTAETLFYRVNQLGLELLCENFDRLLAGPITEFVPADPDFIVHKESDLQHELWQGDPDLYRSVRALTFHGKPQPYLISNNHRIYLCLNNGEAT